LASQLLPGFVTLTLRAVAIATRMVMVLLMITRLTGVNVSTQSDGTALDNGRHCLFVTGEHLRAKLLLVSCTMLLPDVGQRYHGAASG
jgi:hypothetical protein